MLYRKLGSSGLRVSVLGLGCWPIAGMRWTGVTDSDSLAAISQALDLGINFIDTAYMYGENGESEVLVGRAIAGRRAEVVLASKCGVHWEGGQAVQDSRPDRIRRELEESLRRLKVETIDLYQVHAPDPKVPFDETARCLEDLRSQGKIRAVGVSNYDVHQIARFSLGGSLHSVQPHYSMIQRDAERELLPYCISQGIAVCVYRPLERGLLTDRIRPAGDFPEGDARHGYEQFKGERFERTRRMVEELQGVARECGITMAQLALRWTIHRPGVTVALVGATRASQVLENAPAADLRWSPGLTERIDAIVRSW